MRENEAIFGLIRELWEQSSPEHRCSHVSYNVTSCRCGTVNGSAAELVCDTDSLLLWYLDGERYPACLFYPKE